MYSQGPKYRTRTFAAPARSTGKRNQVERMQMDWYGDEVKVRRLCPLKTRNGWGYRWHFYTPTAASRQRVWALIHKLPDFVMKKWSEAGCTG